MKIAFIFPGQGSQYAGMAKEFIENFKESKEVFEAASAVLGYDLAQLCLHGPVEKLNLTENTQPAILAASIAILQPLERRGLTATATAGHSLGEYTAITAAGGFELRDALALVQKRGRYMQEAVPEGTGLMAAVLGMERQDVEKTCHEAAKNGIVAPANYNSPGQIVIEGALRPCEAHHQGRKGAERRRPEEHERNTQQHRLLKRSSLMLLSGKTALVTGAAQGIGRDIALALATDGADVAICDVNLEAAQKTSGDIEARGVQSLALKTDVAASAEVTAAFDQVVEKFGRIDILVNNAGITRDGLILRMKDEDWDLVLSINLKGAFLCAKAALKHMMKQRGGAIINIASIVGVMGNAGQANYVASKAGLIGLTKTIAREYANRGITANAVAPGFIDTAMTQALSENARAELAKQIPMGKLGTPEDVANAVRFLASPWASYITGQVIHVNGGMYM